MSSIAHNGEYKNSFKIIAMGKNTRISDLPKVEIRDSNFNLDEIIEKISAIKPRANDEIEAILCLAHEIKKIKAFLVLD